MRSGAEHHSGLTVFLNGEPAVPLLCDLMQQIKRHHYVPKAYLKAFCDGAGKLRVYRKDGPPEPLHVSPDATQFRRYYYSQPAPDGARDNNKLEALFSSIESEWPATVAALHARQDMSDRMTNLFEFMSLQRVRVPATRDMVEAMLAQTVKDTMGSLNVRGEFQFPSSVDDLPDQVQVMIDPHQSLHAMKWILDGMAPLYNKIGLSIIHNATGLPYLTSDNPVIWFDPSVPFADQRPYALEMPDGPVLFLFPISPTALVLGSHEQRATYSAQGILHGDAADATWVEEINVHIARFAYEAVIAQSVGQEKMIAEFADKSPVYEAVAVPMAKGLTTWHRQVFGPRVNKPKWRDVSADD